MFCFKITLLFIIIIEMIDILKPNPLDYSTRKLDICVSVSKNTILVIEFPES